MSLGLLEKRSLGFFGILARLTRNFVLGVVQRFCRCTLAFLEFINQFRLRHVEIRLRSIMRLHIALLVKSEEGKYREHNDDEPD